MRNSSILKWAHNNKTSKTKTKEEKGNKNWIHSPDSLLKGHVVYLVKFLGSTEVDKPKGIDVVKHGIQKLKFSQQLKKAEGSKTPKVELTISVDGVAIQEPKTKEVMHQYPLHKISYCADDKAEKRFFSFIAKEGDTEIHTCFVFVSDKLAEEITLTIGQAFELAYKKFLDTNGKDIEVKKQLLVLQKRIGILESENTELKKRLKDIANMKGKIDIEDYLQTNGIKELHTVQESALDDATTAGDTTTTSGLNSMTEGSSDEELICLDATANENKLDGLSLDDLNDDDFDPRAESDDLEFNPRATDHSSPSSSKNDTNIYNNNNNNINNNVSFPTPNPFLEHKIDLFGMASFQPSSPSVKQHQQTLSSFQAGLTTGNFSLEELDPLKK